MLSVVVDRDDRRVHDAADAALLPGRLAARRRPRHADLARALRPDLRVPRPAGRHRGEAGALPVAPAGDVVFDHVWFGYGDDSWTLEDVSFTVPAGTTTALVGETGSGKTTLGYLAARLYDVGKGQRLDRRRRRPRPDVRGASRSRRRRLAGDLSLPRFRAREPPLREAGRDRRGGRGRRRGRAHPPRDRRAARGLRHGRRRARLPLLRRREAAHRDRAHDPAQPADPRPRRGDELARHRDRAARAGGARPARPRGGRRSRSRTGSRPCATPTRSSCSTAAASSRAARTRS